MGSSLGNLLGDGPQQEKKTMWKSGANFADRNNILRMLADDMPIEHIQALTRVRASVIETIRDEEIAKANPSVEEDNDESDSE